MENKLTQKQKELVEQNHKLIYKFIYSRNLSIEEHYDIVSIALCKAAIAFDESKGKFSTIAYKCMDNAIKSYYNHLNSKYVIPDEMMLSYDAPYKSGEDDCDSFLCSISNNCSTQDIVLGKIMVNKFANLLTNREKMIVSLLMNGITQSEIATYLKCSRQYINNCMVIIRKKWITYNDNNYRRA